MVFQVKHDSHTYVVLHYEFLPEGQTVNSGHYYEVLKCLRENI